MRSIWTGSIAFGLVNIPVKVFSAVAERALDFDMLDKKDNSAIKFKRVNERTGKEVAWENIVKGFDLNGKYIVLTEEDFEAASPEKTKTINLEAFVNTTDVDLILFDHAYYLSPAKGGERAFSLLETALAKTGKAGVGSFVLRNREKPVLLRSAKGLLILHTLRFLTEIRNPSEYTIKKMAPKRNELTMANSLIKNMTATFNIADYKDTYTAKLMKLIRSKAAGKKLPAPKAVSSKPASDLIEQLQQSLAKPAKMRTTKK
ncbi:Ku protein [Flavihumibacter sp. CACIAM 22H1]|uniref:non-homologous end joining protein Ku n=1 Tax=Flavihumibacter sp. CACIAM 22H1 TaxID=1812911 RepID=UPI0007A8E026|nr:Ku protein [Flavihumibacter sp. CACIAM 22H1]KYP16271.1 MAG: Ku protein [Flavihumibacter sp. CACIAM 22H1]